MSTTRSEKIGLHYRKLANQNESDYPFKKNQIITRDSFEINSIKNKIKSNNKIKL